ncbi:unnamed protein product [Paramecium octaurelia]|uniref:Uncharacterized protein n=1 Tax=Paramecium octaurelia TaxID=43137 RepID=A0A8S1XEY8_PAROT|nr:unnamed protein product [Paramecium octaurelia]
MNQNKNVMLCFRNYKKPDKIMPKFAKNNHKTNGVVCVRRYFLDSFAFQNS